MKETMTVTDQALLESLTDFLAKERLDYSAEEKNGGTEISFYPPEDAGEDYMQPMWDTYLERRKLRPPAKCSSSSGLAATAGDRCDQQQSVEKAI